MDTQRAVGAKVKVESSPGIWVNSFGDKPGFEVSDPEILVALYVEDPFITNGLPPWWKILDFFVDAFCLQPLEFFIHCWEPFSSEFSIY
jgi:hypothetical protein